MTTSERLHSKRVQAAIDSLKPLTDRGFSVAPAGSCLLLQGHGMTAYVSLAGLRSDPDPVDLACCQLDISLTDAYESGYAAGYADGEEHR